MKKLHSTALSAGLVIVTVLAGVPSAGQASAEPGETVRNIFGPQAGNTAAQCRGACGGDCPDSCSVEVTYECNGPSQLRRIKTYACGTHQGCREHDDCLDTCIQQEGAESGSCQQQCDAKALEDFGVQTSAAWMLGEGPYDGKIKFEYTYAAPGELEPAFSCPGGAKRQCGTNAGCVAANNTPVDPVFDSYPEATTDGMRVAKFLSGPTCGNRVCEQSANIRVTGSDSCAGGSCTRFGMEFDYQNADPSAPLECSTSTSGGGSDFIGDLLKLGADASVTRGDGGKAKQGNDGMAELLGMFGKVIASADSPEDLDISITPLDENGNPVESQRVGSDPVNAPAPIPRTVKLPAASGHLFVPMYQLADGSSAGGKERTVRCTHKGAPVLETTFHLRPG